MLQPVKSNLKVYKGELYQSIFKLTNNKFNDKINMAYIFPGHSLMHHINCPIRVNLNSDSIKNSIEMTNYPLHLLTDTHK